MPKVDIRGRDFLRLSDFTAEEINSVIDLAMEMKGARALVARGQDRDHALLQFIAAYAHQF